MENGGHVNLSKAWAKLLIKRMGFVKRKGTTSKSKDTVEDFERRKDDFLEQVRAIVVMEDIIPDLIVNWDQTALSIVPASRWTLEKKGTKRVELIGINDKRQITAVFCGSLSGNFLPLQVIYQGKTPRCHPCYQFPLDWHITHTPTHWSTEETMKMYLHKILFPYIDSVRGDNQLDDDHPALAIFKNFPGQVTPSITELLAEHNVHSVQLPPNCTDRLQPMDLSLNKAAKAFLQQKFSEWYSEQVATQLGGENDQVQPVDLGMVAMKHVGAKWIDEMYSYITDNPHLIVNGFVKAGIPQAIDLFHNETKETTDEETEETTDKSDDEADLDDAKEQRSQQDANESDDEADLGEEESNELEDEDHVLVDRSTY